MDASLSTRNFIHPPNRFTLSLSLSLFFPVSRAHLSPRLGCTFSAAGTAKHTHTHIYTYSSINTSKEAEKHKRESFLFS